MKDAIFVHLFSLLVLLTAVCSARRRPNNPSGLVHRSQDGAFAALGQNQLRGYHFASSTQMRRAVCWGASWSDKEDDQSQAKTAVEITRSSYAAQGGCDPRALRVAERGGCSQSQREVQMPMVAPTGASSSIFKKGRKYVFMVSPRLKPVGPSRHCREARAEVDCDHLRGHAFSQDHRSSTIERAKKMGLQVVLRGVPQRSSGLEFTHRSRARGESGCVGRGDVLRDAVAITAAQGAQRKPKDVRHHRGRSLPKFTHAWNGCRVRLRIVAVGAGTGTLRAGGLIPIARQYPGAHEFVEAHNKEFPGADLSYHSAAGYSGCQILVDAIRNAGSLDRERIRDTILKLDIATVCGAFKVDEGGFQLAHKALLFQWQDGKKGSVWPDDLAPGRPRFPTPPWKQRP